ncbi:Ig-like domain-containing protein [Pseudomonas putida]|nr:Ig-like domain-containing protein [Pseudomonas putida]
MEALAGNLETIEYRLQVIDSLGNPGRDRVLHWSTDLGTFERPQTRTDAEGFASARLRSLSSGEAIVVVDLPVNGEQGSFEPVTFLEQPYFQYVRFTGPVAATQITSAVCRVVNLDGSPEPGVKVQWAADLGGFEVEPAESVTDAEGIARIDYLSGEAGDVTLTVGATHEGQELQALASVRTPVHDLPNMVEREPQEQYFVIDQFHPARFQVRLEPAAAGYPVNRRSPLPSRSGSQTTPSGPRITSSSV